MQELLKEHHQQIHINIPDPPVNSSFNRFKNRNQQTYPFGDILEESKKNLEIHLKNMMMVHQ